jgi:hypothetical protein
MRPRDPAQVKRYWNETLCNRGQKPTGKPGDSKDRILRAQQIQLKILKKEHAENIGFPFDEDDVDEDEQEDEQEDAQEDEESGFNDNDGEFDGDEVEAAMPSVDDANSYETTPAPSNTKKRHHSAESGNKTKNSRPSGPPNPRGGAAQALSDLTRMLGSETQHGTMMAFMQMQQQQAQQQSQQQAQQNLALMQQNQALQQQIQQMQQQSQQQMMMFFSMMRGGSTINSTSSSTPSFNNSSTPSFNNQSSGSNGNENNV